MIYVRKRRCIPLAINVKGERSMRRLRSCSLRLPFRRWFSTVDPKTLVTYLCTIDKGKDPQHPKFTVTPEDAPPQTGHSATAAWWSIYKEGLRVRNQPEQAVMSGDEMFGLYDNVIKALLQELPGADKLSPYIWRTFIEGG